MTGGAVAHNQGLAELLPWALDALRQDQGLTITALATRAGLNPGTVSRILRGQQSPRMTEFGALCDVLGVSPRAVVLSAEEQLGGPQDAD